MVPLRQMEPKAKLGTDWSHGSIPRAPTASEVPSNITLDASIQSNYAGSAVELDHRTNIRVQNWQSVMILWWHQYICSQLLLGFIMFHSGIANILMVYNRVKGQQALFHNCPKACITVLGWVFFYCIVKNWVGFVTAYLVKAITLGYVCPEC